VTNEKTAVERYDEMIARCDRAIDFGTGIFWMLVSVVVLAFAGGVGIIVWRTLL